jgi:hypothetical protein
MNDLLTGKGHRVDERRPGLFAVQVPLGPREMAILKRQ